MFRISWKVKKKTYIEEMEKAGQTRSLVNRIR